MYKKVILTAIIIAAFTSCEGTKKENKKDVSYAKKTEIVATNQQKDEGYVLMKNNCYVCHNPNAESHDVIIAPPFKAVKMRYSRNFDTKKDFVDAVVDWVQNPTEDKALMYGAVKKFNMMPKLPIDTKDLEKIAVYLYDNDVEEPKWMNEHMENEHKGGMGKGKGMGKNKH